MADLTATHVRPFVPALNFETSRMLYLDLGWTELWRQEGLALLSLGPSQMMLQDYYVKEWAENCMLTVEVASASDWHTHASQVLAAGAYGPARVSGPKNEGWAIVTYLWDPSGVLLHFAQFPKRP